jgi:hypothetical protein
MFNPFWQPSCFSQGQRLTFIVAMAKSLHNIPFAVFTASGAVPTAVLTFSVV